MQEYYDWIKAIHLMFVIFWMAGLLYLPRLFVYHTQVPVGGEQDKMFQKMEKNLLRIIMLPASIITVAFGLWAAKIYGFKNLGMWFHIKMVFVTILLWFHHFLAKRRKDFVNGNNKYSIKFYRIINEIPSLAIVFIVILAIVKPFY